MKVVVQASARLHMGFYNFLSDGVAYGGLGAAIEYPSVVVKVYRHSGEGVKVFNRSTVEVQDCVESVVKVLSLSGVSIEILSAVPRHVGLGSTTQTTLAIAYATSKLLGLNYKVKELAVKLCRGMDSGIGVAAFEVGGFIVDSGRRVGEGGRVLCPASVSDLPQPVFRAPIPRSWSFAVVIPKKRRGLDEVSERRAMDAPQQVSKDVQLELYKLVFLYMIPALLRRDIETFGKALTKLQFTVGEYFSKYQGGVFCCEEAEEAVKAMLKHGAKGVGQSSWGSTVYGLVEGQATAKRLCRKVLEEVVARGVEAECLTVKVRNRGADVAVER